MKQKRFGALCVSIATLLALSGCGSSGGSSDNDNNNQVDPSNSEISVAELGAYDSIYFLNNFDAEYISAVNSEMSQELNFVQAQEAISTCSALGYAYESVFSEDGVVVEVYTKDSKVCTEADYSANNLLSGGASYTMAWDFSQDDADDAQEDDNSGEDIEDSGDSNYDNDQIQFQDLTSIDLDSIGQNTMIHAYNVNNQNNIMIFTLQPDGQAVVQYVIDGSAYWQSIAYAYSVENNTLTFTRTAQTFDVGEHPSPDSLSFEASSNRVSAHTMLSVTIGSETTNYEVYSAFDHSDIGF